MDEMVSTYSAFYSYHQFQEFHIELCFFQSQVEISVFY